MAERKDFFGENSYFGEGGYLDRQQSGASSRPMPSGGACADCGGTGDCIHCNGGYYPREDGTNALCGKCRGRGNRRHPYLCHACKGRGYGGKRCGTPTYNEMLRRSQEEARKGKAAYGRGSQSEAYGRSAYGMRSGTFDGYPSLSRIRDDGTLDIFYGPDLNLDDPLKGHAVIRDGKLISKRRPGEPR